MFSLSLGVFALTAIGIDIHSHVALESLFGKARSWKVGGAMASLLAGTTWQHSHIEKFSGKDSTDSYCLCQKLHTLAFLPISKRNKA